MLINCILVIHSSTPTHVHGINMCEFSALRALLRCHSSSMQYSFLKAVKLFVSLISGFLACSGCVSDAGRDGVSVGSLSDRFWQWLVCQRILDIPRQLRISL